MSRLRRLYCLLAAPRNRFGQLCDAPQQEESWCVSSVALTALVPGADIIAGRAVYHYHVRPPPSGSYRRCRQLTFFPWQSNYDSFHWQSTFGDPTYQRHIAVSKVLGLAAVRLVDDLVLPINVTGQSR